MKEPILFVDTCVFPWWLSKDNFLWYNSVLFHSMYSKHKSLNSKFLAKLTTCLFLFIVMNDIVGTMFSKAFMDELLKPQQLYSHRTMKTVLTRLAHASIMRLNPASMDRVRSRDRFKYFGWKFKSILTFLRASLRQVFKGKLNADD